MKLFGYSYRNTL